MSIARSLLVVTVAALAVMLAGCGGSSSTHAAASAKASGAPASVSGPCQLLTSADFHAVGKTLSAAPIEADETAVQIKNCFYEFGSENDAVYLDTWPSPTEGKQAFDGGKDPSVGGGTPVTLTGVGDSAYWLPGLEMIYVTKADKVFDLKISESGASDSQLQSDATTLATNVAQHLA